MSSETVAGMTIILDGHPPISGDLGDDRCGGDRQRQRVAVGNPALRELKLRQSEEVEKHEVWLNAQMTDRPRQRQPIRLGDADRIDLFG